jgi:hypothetical protein
MVSLFSRFILCSSELIGGELLFFLLTFRLGSLPVLGAPEGEQSPASLS